jgi:hypothetical protein
MKLKAEYWILSRDMETGKVAKMTQLPVPALEFYDAELMPRERECGV